MRLRTLGIAGLLVVIAGAGVVHFGVYDVAASSGHSMPVYHLLHYAMRRSVQARADAIAVPDLSGGARRRAGLRLYRRHCVQCHGAPGVAPDAVSTGMTPAPTNLTATARQWRPAELYWVVKHGIKMTAMPGWKYRLAERELWDVVAFLESLPDLSPTAYRRLVAAAGPLLDTPGRRAALPLRPGDAAAGRRALGQYLCATCHRIPSVPGIENEVGPSLEGFGRRRYIGGVLPNTHANLVRWLQDPRAVDPLTAMPDLGLTEQDARDIAAWLEQLE